MSARLSAGPVGSELQSGNSLRKTAQALLQEALDIIDANGMAPEIGARLQAVIDALDEDQGVSGSLHAEGRP